MRNMLKYFALTAREKKSEKGSFLKVCEYKHSASVRRGMYKQNPEIEFII